MTGGIMYICHVKDIIKDYKMKEITLTKIKNRGVYIDYVNKVTFWANRAILQ